MSMPSGSGPLMDVGAVREKLRRIQGGRTRMAAVWRMLALQAEANPEGHPWQLPFLALMKRDPKLIEAARQAVSRYLDHAQAMEGREYLFNIWCFAFPHARWAIWFDLMRREGFYSASEAESEAARFLLIQHRDHHAGLKVKPHPECVDNQAASLCLSSLVIGSLFADGPGGGHLARRLREEALERAETMIGGMPSTGYSGEGSTYHGLIVGYVIPFLVEMIERLKGEPIFDRPLPPHGTRAHDILVAVRRLWIPGGLWLPWDHYGYQYGVAAASLAYLARRAGDPESLSLLEHEVPWSRLLGENVGWGRDHVAWTLAWWPEGEAPKPRWCSWTEPHLGGVRTDPEGRRYLMQMWDRPGAMCARAHVNPNSLVLVADGIPLTADGTPTPECTALNYPGTLLTRSFGKGSAHPLPLGPGCAGSHNAILVDGDEGFHPQTEAWRDSFAVLEDMPELLTGDVTDLYRNRYPDCRVVRRRTRLLPVGAWVVEDWARFEREHELTSRWWFRPRVTASADGIVQETPEGIALQMISLRGPVEPRILRVEGFPRCPDGCSDRVDVTSRGREVRWLWLLWPRARRGVRETLRTGWFAGPVAPDARREHLRDLPPADVHPGDVPWLQAEVRPAERWGFRREIVVPPAQPWWLRLPRGLGPATQIWIDGEPVPLPHLRSGLLPVDIEQPPRESGTCCLEMILDFPMQEKSGEGRSMPSSPVAVCVAVNEPAVRQAHWADGWIVVLTTDGAMLRWPHDGMVEPPGG